MGDLSRDARVKTTQCPRFWGAVIIQGRGCLPLSKDVEMRGKGSQRAPLVVLPHAPPGATAAVQRGDVLPIAIGPGGAPDDRGTGRATGVNSCPQHTAHESRHRSVPPREPTGSGARLRSRRSIRAMCRRPTPTFQVLSQAGGSWYSPSASHAVDNSMASDGAVVRDADWRIAAVRGVELDRATGWPTGELSTRFVYV